MQTRSLGKVAEMNIDYCSQQYKVDPGLGAIATTGFSLAGVPALAETLKLVGH